jgi:hypothetical protein
MILLSVIVGIALVGASFGLMIWGRNFLGEGHAHKQSSNKDETTNKDDHTCTSCGSCASLNSFFDEKIGESSEKLGDSHPESKTE